MSKTKYRFTYDEVRVIEIALVELKNQLIAEGRYTDAVDELLVREGKTLWEVHPFRFDVSGAAPVLDEENEDFRWVVPEEIPSMETVDGTSETISKLFRRSRPI